MRLVEPDLVGDEVEAAHQLAAGRRQPAAEPARRAGALELEHVDAVLVEVHLGEALEAAAQQLDLRGRGALLRREHRGGVEERHPAVAGDDELDALEPAERVQRPQRGQPAVGGRRAAEADDHPAGAGVERLDDELAGAGGRRRDRIVRRPRPPTSSSPDARAISITAVRPSSRHARLDRVAERTGDRASRGWRRRARRACPRRRRPSAPRRSPSPSSNGRVADRLGDRRPRTRCRGACRERPPRAPRHAWPADGPPCRSVPVGPPMAPAPPDRPIVLVSNRGPVSFEREDDGALASKRGAGGLVSGIGPLARRGRRHLAGGRHVRRRPRGRQRRAWSRPTGSASRLLDLDPEAYRLAYDVVSNEVLWFAHHGLWDLSREPAFDATWADAWDAYRAVNHAFADAVAEAAPEGAVVLVQDYHLCLVAARLRDHAARPRAACTSTTRRSPRRCGSARCPTRPRRELHRGPGRPPGAAGSTASAGPTTSSRRPGAVAGVEPPTFVSPARLGPRRHPRRRPPRRSARRRSTRSTSVVQDRSVIGRVDRVELSKNLLRGFQAYGELLDAHPEHRERVVFVANAYAVARGRARRTRAYRERRRARGRARSTSGSATTDWQPIVLDVEDDFPRSVALLRRADVLLVNPIRDGLNLVASEGALGERARRGAGAVTGGGRVGAAGRGRAARRRPSTWPAPPPCSTRRSRCRPTSGADRAARLRAIAEARTPAHWLDDQLAAAALATAVRAERGAGSSAPLGTVDVAGAARRERARSETSGVRTATFTAAHARARRAGRARRTPGGRPRRRRCRPPPPARRSAPRPRCPCRRRPAGGARATSWRRAGAARSGGRVAPSRPASSSASGTRRKCSVSDRPLCSTSTPAGAIAASASAATSSTTGRQRVGLGVLAVAAPSTRASSP